MRAKQKCKKENNNLSEEKFMRKQIRFWLTCLCCITLMAGCAPVQTPDQPLPSPTEGESAPSTDKNTPVPGTVSPDQITESPAPSEGTDPVTTPSASEPVKLPEHSAITTIVPDADFFSNRDQDAGFKENKSIFIQLFSSLKKLVSPYMCLIFLDALLKEIL
jgi:hypothetical protein